MSKLKIGVVGAGAIAREHIKALEDNANTEVVGIVSKNHHSAFVLANEFKTLSFSSVHDMATRSDLDGLVIAVNIPNTADVIKDCCNITHNILVEKPVALDFREATFLEAYVKKQASSNIYVAHNRRFYSATNILRKKLFDIQNPRTVFITDQQDPIEAVKVYGENPIVANNYMFANSIHLVDYLRHFCRGNIIDVQIISPFLGNIEHIINSMIIFDSGDIAYYKCAWCGPGPWSFEVYSGEDYFECRPLEKLTQRSRYSRKDNLLSDDEGSLKAGFSMQLSEFVAACRNESNDLVTITESVEIMSLISRIFDKKI